MGLDSVELVLRFEEAFGVELKDEEVTQTVTPRMVTDLIFSKLKATDERICQSQRAFHILRKAFMGTFGVERRFVTPDTKFRELVPRPREEQMWEQIKTAIAARSWPGLVRPRWMSRLITAVGLAIFITPIYVALWRVPAVGGGLVDRIGSGIVAGLLLAIPFSLLATALTRPFQVCIPVRYQSVRDLIPYAVTSEHIAWTREQVAALVKQVTLEQLGLKESEYTEDSRFVEDFRLS